MVRRDRPDVVVTDLMMPGMGGGELLRAVKAIAPEVEVVLMTAFGTVEGAVAAMKDGAYDFITKPVKRHAIVKSVRLALERASLVAENRSLRARLARLSGEPADGGMVGSAPAVPRRARHAPPGRAGLGHGPAAGRERHREGARGTAPPRPLAPVRGALRAGELRRHPGDHPRVGALRLRAGRLHRGDPAQGGPVPARPRRDALPRRGRGHVAGGPGQAPPGAAGRRGRAARRDRSRCRWTSGSSPPPTATSPPRSGPAGSARTSSTGSTW